MCLILLAWRAHPDYPLVFAGNRDEAYERPSAAADFWRDDARIFGGRDLEKGGTWLGVTRAGRFAAVTNYRERPKVGYPSRSRGDLTAAFLRSDEEPQHYLEGVARHGTEYGPHTLIVGDTRRALYESNRGSGVQELAPGVHGLSNHLMDTPWPKIVRGKRVLGELLSADEPRLVAGLFDLLLDRSLAADAELPDTGVGLARERELSAFFIPGEHYGTRASTVLLIDRKGEALFVERRFGPFGTGLGTTENRLSPEASPTKV
jgi:uncharacterized protein with NRDE domain